MNPILDLATAVVAVGALLAVGGGLAKLVSPTSAVGSMRAIGVPSSELAVRCGALVEVGVGLAVLCSSSWWSKALLMATYVGFAGFSVASLRARSTAPCGCFGATGASISNRHLAVNLAVVAASAAVLTRGSSSLLSTVHASVATNVAFLAVTAVSAVLVATMLSRPVHA